MCLAAERDHLEVVNQPLRTSTKNSIRRINRNRSIACVFNRIKGVAFSSQILKLVYTTLIFSVPLASSLICNLSKTYCSVSLKGPTQQ